MSEVSKEGWTEYLMTINSSLVCDNCDHPVGEHYFPGQRNELCCDVAYCECRGLQEYSLGPQLESCGQTRLNLFSSEEPATYHANPLHEVSK